MIGIGGIRRDYWQEQEVLNLYYRFSPRAWGHGYATEVAQAAVQIARRYLPNVPLVARIRPANTPSIRVVERIGLRRRPQWDTAEHQLFVLPS